MNLIISTLVVKVDACVAKLIMGFDCKFVEFTYSIKCLAINEV